MKMGANWEQDKALWKAWTTCSKARLATRQKYKKIIADFYFVTEKAILQVTEQDLSDYAESSLSFAEELAPSTIKQRMNIIRAYWKFAHRQASAQEARP
jgi:site-specific recombinase XerD